MGSSEYLGTAEIKNVNQEKGAKNIWGQQRLRTWFKNEELRISGDSKD
jgi:hypothetical protein